MDSLKKTRIWTYSVIGLFFVAALVIIAWAFAGTGVTEQPGQEAQADPTPVPVAEPTKAPEQVDTVSQNETDEDGLEEGQMRSYLSGLPVSKEIGNRRPIAVMLNNLKPAQPMCSISRADVVYEYVVEGAITRLMALFEDYKDLDKIGSVRSCREYFVYTMLEFDAIYCHYGQATYAVELLERDYVDNLNGLGKEGDTVYYRTTDKKAPSLSTTFLNASKPPEMRTPPPA